MLKINRPAQLGWFYGLGYRKNPCRQGTKSTVY